MRYLITLIAACFILASCSNDEDNSNPQTFIVGQSYGGGIIFYIDSSGQHGLIADTIDLKIEYTTPVPYTKDRFTWGPANAIPGTYTDLGTGEANTNAIYAANPNLLTAATACYDLNKNGYDDWFLPSKDELNLIYQNLKEQGIGGFFEPYYYWSSSQGGTNTAWRQSFYNAIQLTDAKTYEFKVRPVRKF